MLTRRQFIGADVAMAAASCSSSGSNRGRGASGTGKDFSARFARFRVADEPNGDLSKGVWPDFVVDEGREVKRLYEFQITHGEVMLSMPCFCGCGRSAGHGTTVIATCSG
jgi:hypothetical protein